MDCWWSLVHVQHWHWTERYCVEYKATWSQHLKQNEGHLKKGREALNLWSWCWDLSAASLFLSPSVRKAAVSFDIQFYMWKGIDGKCLKWYFPSPSAHRVLLREMVVYTFIRINHIKLTYPNNLLCVLSLTNEIKTQTIEGWGMEMANWTENVSKRGSRDFFFQAKKTMSE